MKQIITILMVWLLSHVTFAQTSHQQKLIEDIKRMTDEINLHPDLYEERSKAIFMLNATRPWQMWVPFTIEDAMNDVNCALEQNPDDPYLYSLRAKYKRDIYLDYRGAIDDMDRAIALEPDNPHWFLQRANFQDLTTGCFDYQKCADKQDETCAQIVQAVCNDFLTRAEEAKPSSSFRNF